MLQRGPARPPTPWPYRTDGGALAAAVAGVGSVVLFLCVTNYQSDRYQQAGVEDVHAIGAVAGVVLVSAVMLTAATWYRWGYPLRAVAAVAAVAAVLAVALSALPPAVARLDWLTCLLATLYGLLLHGVLAVWVTLTARHAPMWWSG